MTGSDLDIGFVGDVPQDVKDDVIDWLQVLVPDVYPLYHEILCWTHAAA